MAVSSLLKSAAATRKKVAALEDRYVDFAWDTSAKTADDLEAYMNHYSNRADTTGDPGDQLTYTKKLYTAQRSYRSKEIQRMTIAVNEGNATLYDKQNRMIQLYGMAVANEDLNLAQSLRSQISAIDIQIQNMEAAGQRTAAGMANNQVKSLKEFEKMANGMGADGKGFMEMPDGTVVKTVGRLNQELEASGGVEGSGYFTELSETMGALQGYFYDAYQSATTQEAVDKIEGSFGGYITGDKKIDTIGGKLSVNDIVLASQAEQMNNSLFRLAVTRDPVTGQTKYQFRKNNEDDFVWARLPDGSVTAIETYSPRAPQNQTLNTKITESGMIVGKDGKLGDGSEVDPDTVLTIEEYLERNGYTVMGQSGGKVQILTPEGFEVDALVMEGGKLRYQGQPGEFSGVDQYGNPLSGMYEIDVVSGNQREVSPGEISIFGDRISAASKEGLAIINQLAGVKPSEITQIADNARVRVLAEDDIIYGSEQWSAAVRGSTISGGVLQGAAQRRFGLEEQERQRKALEATRALTQQVQSGRELQRAGASGINQTPVTQRDPQSGAPVRQLKVKDTAPPTRELRVTDTPKITNDLKVTPSKRKSKVSVTSNNNTQRLTVR